MSTVASRDGTRIAFDRTGSGPPVVLIGGALSERTAARQLATLLEPHSSVIAYDRRGRGDSGDNPSYAVEREIEDLESLVDAAGGSASVFGMSSGAVLALESAARGVAIHRLALYEPPLIVDDTRPPLPPDFLERLTDLTAQGRRGDAVAYFMQQGVGLPAEAVAAMRDQPSWPGLEAVAHTLPYDAEIVGRHPSGGPLSNDRWAGVTAPTMVIDGGASPAWIGNAVGALVELLPDARRRTLEGQTHQYDPAVLAPVLIDFFEASGTAAAGAPA